MKIEINPPYTFDKRVDPLTDDEVYQAFQLSNEEFEKKYNKSASLVRLVVSGRATMISTSLVFDSDDGRRE